MDNNNCALVAMSGGVDSSVAAYLTLQQGLPCIGGTMFLHDTTCKEDAEAVAQRLGIPFRTFDAMALFRQQIMDSFVQQYEAGLTPNPCIQCNRYLKFGYLLEQALELGCSHVVTGHYARIRQAEDGRFLLCKAADTPNVVGQHRGAVAYTLGQRKGLGLAMGEPVYVCTKDMEANTVTVGPNEALFHRCLRATDWNWISLPDLDSPIRVKAKTRSRMAEQPATVYPEADGFARVEFDEPQRAITPGQAVVLYDGDVVVGGGTITEVY